MHSLPLHHAVSLSLDFRSSLTRHLLTSDRHALSIIRASAFTSPFARLCFAYMFPVSCSGFADLLGGFYTLLVARMLSGVGEASFQVSARAGISAPALSRAMLPWRASMAVSIIALC